MGCGASTQYKYTAAEGTLLDTHAQGKLLAFDVAKRSPVDEQLPASAESRLLEEPLFTESMAAFVTRSAAAALPVPVADSCIEEISKHHDDATTMPASNLAVVQGLADAAAGLIDNNPVVAAGLAKAAADLDHTNPPTGGTNPAVAAALASTALCAAESGSATAAGLTAAAIASLNVAQSHGDERQ